MINTGRIIIGRRWFTRIRDDLWALNVVLVVDLGETKYWFNEQCSIGRWYKCSNALLTLVGQPGKEKKKDETIHGEKIRYENGIGFTIVL